MIALSKNHQLNIHHHMRFELGDVSKMILIKHDKENFWTDIIAVGAHASPSSKRKSYSLIIFIEINTSKSRDPTHKTQWATHSIPHSVSSILCKLLKTKRQRKATAHSSTLYTYYVMRISIIYFASKFFFF